MTTTRALPTPPLPNSLWTDQSGVDVTVNTCCDLDATPESQKSALVIYTDKLGACHSHPLHAWQLYFRPSMAQQAVNVAALSSWCMAVNSSMIVIDETITSMEGDPFHPQELLSHLKASLSDLNAAGPSHLLRANIITDYHMGVSKLFKDGYAEQMASIYDATLRAYPQPNFLYAQEILARELEQNPILTEREFYMSIAQRYVQLCIEQGAIDALNYEKRMAQVIAWPLNGFPS
jgi:hypothetical protein